MNNTEKPVTKRLFIAIDTNLPEIKILQDSIKEKIAKLNGIDSFRTQNILHITLYFFGETPINTIDLIIKSLEAALLKVFKDNIVRQIKLENKVKLFGDNHNIVALTFEEYHFIKNLAEYIADSLLNNGIISKTEYLESQKRFYPHITLGRIKKVTDIVKIKEIKKELSSLKPYEFGLKEFQLKQIVLYESYQGNYCPIYTFKIEAQANKGDQ